MSIYSQYLRNLLFSLDPECAHELVCGLLANFGFLAGAFSLSYKRDDLACNLFGHKLNNPIGLAAGFDKNGHLPYMLSHLGFGFAEIGSITGYANKGNAKPRIFRLPEYKALINRIGLANDGADIIAKRLEDSTFSLPIGINIAKTNDKSIVGKMAIKDVLYSFDKIKNLPIAYVAINASCPNTQEGIIEATKELEEILYGISLSNSRQLPILLKLSPDSSYDVLQKLVDSSLKYRVSGYICGNTSKTRIGLPANQINKIGQGGLSGQPLKPLALDLCRKVNKLKDANQIIIGLGGISTGADAFDFIAAGASFVQIYTSIIYEGPNIVHKINEELSEILKCNN